MAMHVTAGTTIQSLFLWLRMNVTIHVLEIQMKLVDRHGDSLFTGLIKSSIYQCQKTTNTTTPIKTTNSTAEFVVFNQRKAYSPWSLIPTLDIMLIKIKWLIYCSLVCFICLNFTCGKWSLLIKSSSLWRLMMTINHYASQSTTFIV